MTAGAAPFTPPARIRARTGLTCIPGIWMAMTGPIPAGTLVGGRYRIEEALAGEGSSAVYRAADTRLDRHVALRALPAAEAGGGQQGRAAARLVHPNVARVLDFGTDAEHGLEFVVADLGTGGSLAALIAQRGTPPLPLALRMVQEAAAGMAAAHRAGLVHGDLHPGIIWLSRDEGRLRVQVLGLGLNPAAAAPPRATARYAAPERLRRARELAATADVFSLGAMAYEVFAGLPADWNQLLLAMARGQAAVAPSLLEQRPEIPAHVAQAVRRALAADPASRWPDAGEMAAHLIEDIAAPAQPADASAASPVIVSLPADLAPQPAEPAPAVAPAPEPAAAAAESTEPEVPAKPGRQPLVAGRRGKPIALANTDLADTLYIPPAIAKKGAPKPDAAPAAQPAEPVAAAASAAPPPPPPAPVPAPEPVIAAAPAPVPERPAPQPVVEETIAAPMALVPAPQPAMAVTAAADAPVVSITALPERRRNGMARLGQPSPSRRGLLAASIVVAVVVIGGVAVKMGMAGGTSAASPEARTLAARALASAGGAPAAAQPQQPAGVDSAQPAAQTAAPADEALTPEEQRRRDEELKRLEEQRRQQQRQRDSLRQAQVAAAQAAGRPVPPAPAPQQVALQTPARPVPSMPAPQPEQRVQAPAPAPAAAAPTASNPPAEAAAPRPAADRIYGAEEVDRAPSLANATAFRAAVQRTYPSSLRGTRQPGNAVVSFVVLPDGRVDRSSVSVVEASQPAFRSVAAEAITAARFNPARVGGRPVRSQVTLRLAWHPDQ
jgi:TonB family protein